MFARLASKNAVKRVSQVRFLSVHEFRSASLLKQYGVGTPKGIAAFTPEEAYEAAKKLGTDDLVVKAQALTGGRGKGHFDTGYKSGVHLVKGAEEVKQVAKEMLNHQLITKQSGAAGKPVSAVYVVERKYPLHESYLSVVMDRKNQSTMIIASSEGGMSVEEVAKKNPEAIKKFPVNINEGVSDELATKIASGLGFTADAVPKAAADIKTLYKIFKEKDATQVEINPLTETKEHDIECVDAKFNFDKSAAYRQKDVFAWRDVSQEDPDEVEASKYGLNFIKLNGNIGCLVNGAGLAMATMDVVKLYGGAPANFLDVGGASTPKTIEKAFELIMSEKKVNAIFVNIFGGIVRCDYVADGLINATKNLGLKVPVIARLRGTNLEIARKMIENSGLKHLYLYSDLDEAAKKAVELGKI
ncbi:succinate--CoA ligase beta chain [Brettanomyces bruxellensis]|uniref:Succinate--CoA ligase [ADP-forming] subunit beta, mitochondrial n=1 Tax=Dekkera bruxellensis TaxID=5007 RepID=A0A8H6BBD6_DEKBR|nr:succinate--CoA ligase beta chain [Brettanomyces bruxellensis]EIF46369.1 succinyl-CoA ligase beta-chain, mitochondrial precursor [Brettanomyces bruxellensis AWRI1499]KAF6008718.1 succinate--CoA ligase beta chain [Brettanomyces bruxellensis]KAF6008914.1 succinate--CoA ligase beta chain [Brettanomyces bruxellensis]QOU20458.1 succinate--CoA ligase beta chain [Brettanomyces bruxellensis]